MPTYEYRCEKCGEHLEVVQSFAERQLKRHRTCGGDLERVIHSRGVVFKGSGFYKTDSRPKVSESNGDDKASDKKTDKSEKKTDRKTEKKTDKKADPAPASTSAGSGESSD
ncbi:MAG: FmdB family zinc ribbon protein [Acidimicrobiia bacterium]